MVEYYIIGNGGFAKEVYYYAELVLGKNVPFKGFIDYKPTATSKKVRNVECAVIDEDFFLQNVPKVPTTYLYVGLADPKQLEKIVQKFSGYTFPNLIHPTATADYQSLTIGEGNIVTGGCFFSPDVEIGSFNIFNGLCTIGHDVTIGSYNVFGPGSKISGTIVMGSGNLFGLNAATLQNITIGNNNVLGAGALAIKSFGSNMVMIGSPARQLS
jgi:sugar O-acyltransferase (sialic acid O-acetyltransferase NeuD family)